MKTKILFTLSCLIATALVVLAQGTRITPYGSSLVIPIGGGNGIAVGGNADTLGNNPPEHFLSTNDGIFVIITNGVYEVQGSLPFVFKGGLGIGGTNGAGTNNTIKTNWSYTYLTLDLINVGTGTGMELANTNAIGFMKPAFGDALDKSTNFANYVIYIPANIDIRVAPRILLTASKSGTAGNVVLSFTMSSTGNPMSFPGSFATEFLSTNAFSGAGTRASSYEITPAWTLTAGATLTIQIARDGDDTADTLVGNLIIQSLKFGYVQQ